ILAPVRQAHRNLIRVVNDVAVGQNEAVRGDDETGATAPDFAWAAPTIETLFDIDVNDRRADAIGGTHDGARIFVEQYTIIARRRDAWPVKFRSGKGFVQQGHGRMRTVTCKSETFHA